MSPERSLFWAGATDVVTVFAVAQGKLKQPGAVSVPSLRKPARFGGGRLRLGTTAQTGQFLAASRLAVFIRARGKYLYRAYHPGCLFGGRFDMLVVS